MSTIEDIREEAIIARKWAAEKSDWLENPNTVRRYAGDPSSLARRAHEITVMFRNAERSDKYAEILSSREKVPS